MYKGKLGDDQTGEKIGNDASCCSKRAYQREEEWDAPQDLKQRQGRQGRAHVQHVPQGHVRDEGDGAGDERERGVQPAGEGLRQRVTVVQGQLAVAESVDFVFVLAFPRLELDHLSIHVQTRQDESNTNHGQEF
jgi:hypothetical protein